MSEVIDNPELPENTVEQNQVGISLPGKNKWDTQQRLAMVIVAIVIVSVIGGTLFTRDEQGENARPSSVPQAPSDIAGVVPGDLLPPAAQKHIDDADIERATNAKNQNSAVIDSAPPINKTPSAPPVSADPPPAAGSAGGHPAGSTGGHATHLAFDPKMAENKLKAMMELQTRWKAPNSIKFVAFEEEKPQNAATQMQMAQASVQQPIKIVPKGNHIPAGATYYAQWDKSMNSDAGASMAKATIRGGELDGAIVIGQQERKDSQMLVHFTLMSYKGQSLPIDAIAVNADTSADSVATEIDNHTFTRWVAFAGASFLEGAATMAERSGQTAAATFAGPITVATNYDTKQLIAGTVGNLGRRGAAIAGSYFNTPPTLIAQQGDDLGVIFATQTEDYTWLPKTSGF